MDTELAEFKSLLENQKTYYTMEIYPPNKYDDKTIIREDEVVLNTETGEQLVEVNNSNESSSDFFNMINYIKTEWITELPFYKFTDWKNVEGDMVRLSNKFPDWMFVLYCKSQLFMDNLWVKIYRNGRLIHLSNEILYEIKLKMPNGIYKDVDKNGQVILNPSYDIKRYLGGGNRDFSEFMNIATSLTVSLGHTVADLGSLVGEVAMASKVLSIGLNIVQQMQNDAQAYQHNNGKCKHLIERCNNIIHALNSIPPELVNIQYVVSVVDKLKNAQDLIHDYNKKWRITKFLGSSTFKNKFDGMNSELSDCFYDFGVNFQITQKVFKYKN